MVVVLAVFLYPSSVTLVMEAIGPTGSVILLVLVSLAAAAVLGVVAPYVLLPKCSRASYLMALAPMLFLLLSASQNLISNGELFIGDYPVRLIGVMMLNSTIIVFAAHLTMGALKDDS